MRGTITLLQYEHGIIRQVSDVLAELVRRESLAKHRRQVVKISEFMESYVARFHHLTEERFLFKEALGMSAELAQGAKELMEDHVRVNALIARLRQLSDRKEAYEDGTLAFVAKEIVENMTRHIRHEEDVYYPRMEEALSMERDADLLTEIDEFTSSKFGAGFLRQYEDKAIRLQEEVLGPGYYLGIQ